MRFINPELQIRSPDHVITRPQWSSKPPICNYRRSVSTKPIS